MPLLQTVKRAFPAGIPNQKQTNLYDNVHYSAKGCGVSAKSGATHNMCQTRTLADFVRLKVKRGKKKVECEKWKMVVWSSGVQNTVMEMGWSRIPYRRVVAFL